jgi:predicted metalloprotease
VERLFFAEGGSYVKPKLVLYSGSTPTACGTGQSASGPFYCPGDQKVYLDLDFFNLMQQRFKVSGEFAEAYVIAHEVGHHVQNLLGLSEKSTRRAARQASARPTPCPCAWNCRPTALPASGPSMRTRTARSSNRATSKRH